jgi:hypothetical protein
MIDISAKFHSMWLVTAFLLAIFTMIIKQTLSGRHSSLARVFHFQNYSVDERFQVLTVVLLNIDVFWDVRTFRLAAVHRHVSSVPSSPVDMQ